MFFRPASYQTICSEHRLLGAWARLLAAGVFLTVLMCGLSPGDSYFVSWFYKLKKTPPPVSLYERGYRVTPSDRVELDRVMG